MLNTEQMKTMQTTPILMPRFLAVSRGSKRTLLPLANILHIDASSNYSTIHAEGYPPLMMAKVLKKYEQLLERYGFMRINNSVLINPMKVREIRADGVIIMENECMFYPSRRRKAVLKKLFVDQLAS